MNRFRAWWRSITQPTPAAPHLFGATEGQGVITNGAVVTVTTTPTLLLAANGIRRMAVLSNTGTTTVTLGNASVVAGQGIPLAANQSWVDEQSYGAWYGIVASGTSSVAPTEVA
ncbi:MAG: hypothetical protein LC793_13065 [Thermomicrobia bacterium]|nr:hypothetical protein [Thermomicrobia bacterium]MCA1722762.1 hypothetical protein [Thermomicrobia bacterium]